MTPESYLTVGEFTRAQKQQTGILLQHLGDIRNELRSQGERLTTVETKIDERTESATAATKKARNTSAKWSATVAGVTMVVVEVVKALAK
jgi:hypothetical protein